MVALDYSYLADLVVNAQNGDSDAFAELYAATYQKQYNFACSYLKDEYLAQDALQEIYIIALRNLSKLRDPMLLIAWLNQINFRICFHLHKRQERYNEELIGFDYFTDEEFSQTCNTPPNRHYSQQCGGTGGSGRFTEISYESDFKSAVYGGAGNYPEILPGFKI